MPPKSAPLRAITITVLICGRDDLRVAVARATSDDTGKLVVPTAKLFITHYPKGERRGIARRAARTACREVLDALKTPTNITILTNFGAFQPPYMAKELEPQYPQHVLQVRFATGDAMGDLGRRAYATALLLRRQAGAQAEQE